MSDTIVVTTQVPVVIEVAGPQGPQGHAGVYGTTAGTATEGNDARIATIHANSIDTRKFSNTATGGYFSATTGDYYQWFDEDSQTTLTNEGGNAGYFKANAGSGAGLDNEYNNSGFAVGGNAGYVNVSGSDASVFGGGGNGGFIELKGGSAPSNKMDPSAFNSGGAAGYFRANGGTPTSTDMNCVNYGGHIDISGGSGGNSFGGSIDLRGSINTTNAGAAGSGGQIIGTGGNMVVNGFPGNGGSVNISGGSGSIQSGVNLTGGNGGHFIALGGNADTERDFNGANGGTIDVSGILTGPGGSINLAGGGGSISTYGYRPEGPEGVPPNDIYHGGDIRTHAGVNGAGGSISTYNGGGDISTRGTGSIELGVTGTRTTLVGSAAITNKIITLPNATGTVALTAHTHGSLTSDGKLGTSANCYVTTTAGGAIIAGGVFFQKYTLPVTTNGANATNPSAFGKRSEQIFTFDANVARQFTLSAGVLGDTIAVTAQAGASALGSVEVSSITVGSPIATLQVGHSRDFIYNGTAWELVPLRSSGGVTQIVAGSNVSISPTSGTGAVTINTTNSFFVLSATSASGTAGQTGQTVGPFIAFFNGTGGAGYSSGITKRQRTLHQACVIKKACITLSSGNATTVSDGVASFYNNTTSTEYVLYSGLVADTTQTFVPHDATNLNITVAAGDRFSLKISWPTTNPADVRVMVDLYCYPV